jgi:hypothetical protein
MTLEHFINQRFRNLVGYDEGHNAGGYDETTGRIFKTYPLDVISRHVFVCADCNNNFLEPIQSAAFNVVQPMVKGDWPEVMPPWEAAAVSRWAIVTAILLRYSAEEKRFPEYDDELLMIRRGEFRHSWQVYIAPVSGYGTVHSEIRWGEFPVKYGGIAAPEPVLVEAVQVSIGRFAFQVLLNPLDEFLDPRFYQELTGWTPLSPYFDMAIKPTIQFAKPDGDGFGTRQLFDVVKKYVHFRDIADIRDV